MKQNYFLKDLATLSLMYKQNSLKGFQRVDFIESMQDDLLAGAQKGELILIASRPSMGKTTLALNMLKQIQEFKKQSALYITLDTTFEKIKAQYQKIKNESSFFASVNSNTSSHIWFCELISETVEKISGLVRVSQKNSLPLDYVFVDYFQLLQSEKIFFDTKPKMNYILSELKKLASEQNTVVVVLAQLKQSAEEHPNHFSVWHDLRDVSDYSPIDRAIYLYFNNGIHFTETFNLKE